MNKWIEVYMQEHDLKPNEHFKIISEQDNHEYYFSENGQLCRYSNTGYNYVNYKIWGKVMSGDDIEKVEPKGRYIPKNGEYFWYVTTYGFILKDRFINEQNKYAIEHNIVFRTEEEAKDYKWFLDQVDKYKKEFITGQPNYRLCFDFEYNKLFMVQNNHIKHHKDYFGNIENIKEFRNIAGDDRIKKYMFDVWE